MTTDDPLSRLSAGLAEDDRIARGTFEPDMSGQDRWQLDGANVWTEEPRPALVVKHAWPNEARHIARQDPALTVRRVEAIRKVLRRHEEAERDSVLSDRDAGFEAGLYAALEILAEPYLEDATETGGTP